MELIVLSCVNFAVDEPYCCQPRFSGRRAGLTVCGHHGVYNPENHIACYTGNMLECEAGSSLLLAWALCMICSPRRVRVYHLRV